MLSFTPVLPLAPSVAFYAIIRVGVSTEIQVKNSTEIICNLSHNNNKWQTESMWNGNDLTGFWLISFSSDSWLG